MGGFSVDRFSVEGGGLVGDVCHHASAAVAAGVFTEAVAPLEHDGLGLSGVEEAVSGQDFPVQAGEEGFGGVVVEAGPDPAHGLADAHRVAQLHERAGGVGGAPVGVKDHPLGFVVAPDPRLAAPGRDSHHDRVTGRLVLRVKPGCRTE